jgi:uncharacterized membrane protein YbhN (UPF0104 family)
VKRLLTFILKLGVSGGLIGYLVWDAIRNDAFALLIREDKDWGLLVAAMGFFLASATFCFLRWGYLVRALGIRFSHGEALRLGMIGYLVNLAPMGVVGGDLVKMYLLARLRRSTPAEAVASVLVDRAIGLYMLFAVASLAILWTGFWKGVSADIVWLCYMVWGIASGGLIAALLILVPRSWPFWIGETVACIPWVGGPAVRLGQAIRRYRAAWQVLLMCVTITLLMDIAYATAVYLAAKALFAQVPSWKMHLVIAPLSNSASAIPLPMGPFEFVLDRLYLVVPTETGTAMQPGQGLVVALAVRLFSVFLAVAGAVYFLGVQPQLLATARQLEKLGPTEKNQSATDGQTDRPQPLQEKPIRCSLAAK